MSQTKAKRHPLTTKFEAPADTHTVLVVTANYWGRGDTKALAMKKVKEQGGDPGKYGYWALYFGEGFLHDTGWVDQMGRIYWEYEPSTKAREEGRQPVKEKVPDDAGE